MIERMKKLSLLVHADDRSETLEHLQGLGVVHVEVEKDIQRLEILVVKEKLSKLQKTHTNLKTLAETENKMFHQESYPDELDVLCDEVEKTLVEINDLEAQGERVAKELKSQEPWGAFDLKKIQALAEAGVKLRFGKASVQVFSEAKKDLELFEINREGTTVFYVVLQDVGAPDIEILGQEVVFGADTHQLHEQILHLDAQIRSQRSNVLGYARYLDQLSEGIFQLEDRLAYSYANHSFVEVADGKALVLQGWFPEDATTKVTAFVEKARSAYLVEDVAHEEQPPISLKNGLFARLFEPITKVYSLPNYHEIDTTAFLAPFFALFVGLCLADVGYGLVMLAVTLPALFLLKGDARRLAALGVILSLMTILGGLLLGDIFGITAEKGPYPTFLRPFAAFPTMQEAMKFPILLAFVQLLLGHIIRTINGGKNFGLAGALKPVGTFLLVAFVGIGILQMGYFGDGPHLMVGPIPIGPWIYSIPHLPQVTLGLFVAGTVLVLLFNGVEHHLQLWKRPLVGLWELFEFFSQIVGDFLSYLRLFALGLAGALLAMSFNQIGLMVLGTGANPLNWVSLVVVLLLGHSINLGLALIASFVHPVRLTFVEFYKSIGFKGGGRLYSPFRLKFKSNNH